VILGMLAVNVTPPAQVQDQSLAKSKVLLLLLLLLPLLLSLLPLLLLLLLLPLIPLKVREVCFSGDPRAKELH
jgi:hypothetical protein